LKENKRKDQRGKDRKEKVASYLMTLGKRKDTRI
jgi:hypothetical protein